MLVQSSGLFMLAKVAGVGYMRMMHVYEGATTWYQVTDSGFVGVKDDKLVDMLETLYKDLVFDDRQYVSHSGARRMLH